MMPVILWTDALIFLLIAVGVTSAWWIRQRPHLMLPWQRVARSSVGMVSLLVLSLFIIVGVLDRCITARPCRRKTTGRRCIRRRC